MDEDQAKAWVKVKENQKRVIDACLKKHSPRKSKVAIFMAGIPGAGKTEFVRNLTPDLLRDLVIIEHDQLVEYIDGYLPENYYVFRKAGSTLVTELFKESLKQGYSFIFDGTLSHDNGYRNIEKAIKKDYKVAVIYIHQDIKSAWQLTRDRELVKKRSIEKEGFINTSSAINASLRKIFGKFSDEAGFTMWIIKKNGMPGYENSEFILYDNVDMKDSKKAIETVLNEEYNVKELEG
jgi:predicted ABC-type ATPase